MNNKDIILKLRNLIKEIQQRDPPLKRDSLSDAHARDMGSEENFGSKKQSEITKKNGFWTIDTYYETGSFPWFNPPSANPMSCLLNEVDSCVGVSFSDPADALYLDLETTGLLGAGTVAFLVGLGRWRKEQFVLTQFLLIDRDCEPHMLEAVAEEMCKFSTLVTFNGKSFDVPLLRNRFIMNELISRFSEPTHHIDLYSLVRKLGKHPVFGLSLKESMKRFVGVSRQNDIPGHIVPALYFMYEQDNDVSVLEPVLEHNRIDVLDMGSLLHILTLVFTGEHMLYRDASALAGVGKYLLHKGDLGLAKQIFALSLRPHLDPYCSDDQRFKNMRLQAEVMRKQGDWRGAALLWTDLAAQNAAIAEDYLWLARYYETQEQNTSKALDLIKTGLSLFPDLPESTMRRLSSRARRLGKLLAKNFPCSS